MVGASAGKKGRKVGRMGRKPGTARRKANRPDLFRKARNIVRHGGSLATLKTWAKHRTDRRGDSLAIVNRAVEKVRGKIHGSQ